MDQQQFLNVIDRDEAEKRFRAALDLQPLSDETVALRHALGRVLASDVCSGIDVPAFDRSNFDGFAVRALDTVGADEETPRALTILDEIVTTGMAPQSTIEPGTAAAIATGAVVPRGADAVVMVENTDRQGQTLQVNKPVTPGFGIAFAGTDMAKGEVVLRQGQWLTSRETGVLAAIGVDQVQVHRKPRIAIISTGDEIIEPGQPIATGKIYDSNSRVVADAVRELGAEPFELGIVPDDRQRLQQVVQSAIAEHDAVLLSGGTSKGAGDYSYQVVQQCAQIVAHGVALKPGKPICLAHHQRKPVVVLPGFPTSAIFTFHEFVAPVIRQLAGRAERKPVGKASAELAVRVNSEIGRTEYLLVSLLPAADPNQPLQAYPLGKGSGSVTTFSQADGFVAIDRHCEQLQSGAAIEVQLTGRDLELADLTVVGSHCLGLDYLLSCLHRCGWRTKFLAVGSTAGLHAARNGQCDVAGIHLLDADTDQYNVPFIDHSVELTRGYHRMQGIVFRRGDARFENKSVEEAVAICREEPDCQMVNRNQGSGTRILVDQLLGQHRPSGYAVQARSHHAVAAAIAQQRADWGVAIRTVAERYQLGFIALRPEQFDFVTPVTRTERPAVRAFYDLLCDASVVAELKRMFLDVGEVNHREAEG